MKKVDSLRLVRTVSGGECCVCAEEESQRNIGDGQSGQENDMSDWQARNVTDVIQQSEQLQLTNGQTQSPSVNSFIEQLISDRLKDLVTVQPDGEIKLNMSEQLSATL